MAVATPCRYITSHAAATSRSRVPGRAAAAASPFLATLGTVITPFQKQVWGDEFGMCTDKSGVTWMVNVTAG